MHLLRSLKKNMNNNPYKTFVKVNKKVYSYRDLDSDICAFQSNLDESFNLNKGDRIAIILHNSYESIISILGSLSNGCIFIPINPGLHEQKMRYIINNSKPKIIITDQSIFRKFYNIFQKEKIIIVDSDNEVTIDSFPFQALLEEHVEFRSKKVIDSDIASIIYTSGSTGIPKGVTMTHMGMKTSIDSITSYLNNTPSDIVLNVLPLSFDYGLYQPLMTLSFGGTLILEKNFIFFSNIIKKIKQEEVTGFPMVPAIAEILLKLKGLDFNDLSTL
jgi:acyl-CoA synthetase (AMP-forming)/AMP-acid ligase II